METVFVGLSGGVDSAVSAHLLKKEGYAVVGAFIKGWEPDFLPCTGAEDKLSAMRVAAHLKIPFVAYDLEEEYKQGVVDYFVSEYKAGRTPNPDVMCNRLIKFGVFWERAKKDGADFIATGHYAINKQKGTNYELHVSDDKEKDQTYFLWTLNQGDLSHTLFPIGRFEKSEVRRIAEEAGLPNASRRDSQGLCFLGHVDMAEFLKRYIPPERGAVRNDAGEIIGEHEGAVFYTLGQRHGFNTQSGERLYVVKKDISKNELTVSHTPISEESKATISLLNTNVISDASDGEDILARYRYRQPLIPAHFDGNSIRFRDPELIAPGQSIVFYDRKGEVCLGGGIAA